MQMRCALTFGKWVCATYSYSDSSATTNISLSQPSPFEGLCGNNKEPLSRSPSILLLSLSRNYDSVLFISFRRIDLWLRGVFF